MHTDGHAPGGACAGSGRESKGTHSLHRAMGLSGGSWLRRETGPLDPLPAVTGVILSSYFTPLSVKVMVTARGRSTHVS